ncbi:MAG: ABC transporter ATP-binding protein [Clostridiales bacterium]|nr:ABC transporter ATP-binding protein [Clostridiales bacterium]
MELTLNKLTKQYRDKTAVDSLSVTLTPGIYGLLGANGAGKTTLMRMVCGILNPTSGNVLLDGKDTISMGESYRDLLGYLPQNFGYYPVFTAIDYLLYVAALKGLTASAAKVRANELLELVSLQTVSRKKIKTFSGGMKRRLGIAQALLNDPMILVLDEPTAGLDPKERVHFRNLISDISKDKIVILSTHIVSDVEYIADQILIMKAGRLVHQGKPDEITASINGYVWECKADPKQSEQLNDRYIVSNLKHEGNQDMLRIVSKQKPYENAVQVEPTLEDLYLYYFSEQFGENELPDKNQIL